MSNYSKNNAGVEACNLEKVSMALVIRTDEASRLDRSSVCDVNETRIATIKEAKEILTIPVLWDHFQLAGMPAKSCLSPFRRERRPSFSVYPHPETGEELFKDHGDLGVGGDSFDFFKECSDLDGREAVEAFLELAEQHRWIGNAFAAKATQIEKPKAKPLPRNFADQCADMCKRLLNNPGLCGAYGNKRGWKKETILQLANEGSLGWFSNGPAFIYTTGIKVRSDMFGERHFHWQLGSGSIWRADRIANASKVYITEGESDCITMIDSGIENEPGVAVLALHSASTRLDPELATLFTDKEVTLCMDNDDPGKAAVERNAKLLKPFAAMVKTLNLEGIFSNERK